MNRLRLLPALSTLIFATLLAGCATAPTVPPPQVIIVGKPVAEVRATVLNHYLDKGFTPLGGSEFTMVFEKLLPFTHATSLAYGSMMDLDVWSRQRVTVVPAGTNEVRVMINLSVIGNHGSAFEHVTEVRGPKASAPIQAYLDQLKGNMEK